ncbi:MAG: hypothetical protein CMC76_05515 [Flavobacteriaceae bacterium]|nr:hypothetical protein [Flavobacteriaceae bacterium]|tara:strand:- start:384 stop:872 length:489 start_codon:yes stop_codon:yes gene_type:complete
MKKITYLFLFLAVTSLTIQSCKKDDDGDSLPSVNNEISIDGTVYSIGTTGSLESYGENQDGSFDWDVVLTSSEAYVYLDLNTNSSDGLVAGTYNFSENRAAFTFVDVYINITDGDTYSNIDNGTVNIDISGDTVYITFSFVNEIDGTDITIQGGWSGTLTTI